jgi:hypothetical protein
MREGQLQHGIVLSTGSKASRSVSGAIRCQTTKRCCEPTINNYQCPDPGQNIAPTQNNAASSVIIAASPTWISRRLWWYGRRWRCMGDLFNVCSAFKAILPGSWQRRLARLQRHVPAVGAALPSISKSFSIWVEIAGERRKQDAVNHPRPVPFGIQMQRDALSLQLDDFIARQPQWYWETL